MKSDIKAPSCAAIFQLGIVVLQCVRAGQGFFCGLHVAHVCIICPVHDVNVVQWYYKRVCCITFLLHCIQRPCPILWVYLLTNWTGPGPPLAMPLHCIHVSEPHHLKNAWYWPKPVLGYEWLWITSWEVWSIGCSYMKLTSVVNGFIVL